MKKLFVVFALLLSATAAHAGFTGKASYQLPYVTPGGYAPTGAAAITVASNTYVTPIVVPAVCVSTGIAFVVGTASGKMQVGIYDSAGNQLVASATTTVPAAGVKSIPFATPYTLQPGYYYAAIGADNITATFTRVASDSMFGWYVYTNGYPFASTITVPGTVGTRAFWMAILCQGGINQ